MQDTNRASTFSGGVVALFGTQVFGAVTGMVSGILLARLLGPAGKGDYYIIVLIPATAMVVLQLGIPRAFGFFSARGRTTGIIAKANVLTLAMSAAAILILLALLPLFRQSLLDGIEPQQVLFAFIAFPLALNAAYTTAIVMGRKAVRWYSSVNIAYSIGGIVLLVAILGGLGPSVNGAILVFLGSSLILTIGSFVAARRVATADVGSESVSYRELFRYGLPFFPGSLAAFFSYRVDAFLIAFLIANSAEPLGYYSLAVGFAEMVFFFPRAVATLFFPHVAGSPREDSDRQVAMMSRVTILITGTFAGLMIPGAVVLIWLILPAFVPSLLPLVVLLPGVVAFSATFVLSGYLNGIDRPGITSTAALISLAVNIAANLILIPRLGIVGASVASLISYSLSSLMLTAIAARLTGTPLLDFWVPRVSDIQFVAATSTGLLRRLRRRPSAMAIDRGA